MPEVHPAGLETAQQRINDYCISCYILIPAEQPVLSARGNRLDEIFHKVFVHSEPFVRMVPVSPAGETGTTAD
jgi:hypothetical protein